MKDSLIKNSVKAKSNVKEYLKRSTEEKVTLKTKILKQLETSTKHDLVCSHLLGISQMIGDLLEQNGYADVKGRRRRKVTSYQEIVKFMGRYAKIMRISGTVTLS